MIKPVQTVIFLAAGAAVTAAACATAGAPPRDETVPLLTLAKDPEAWRGREVRTCGPTFQGHPAEGEWQLSMPRSGGRHLAGIYVLGCAEAAPEPDLNGCVSGRIARRDGSIEPTQEGQAVTVSSDTISYDWYLHAQCRAPRRD